MCAYTLTVLCVSETMHDSTVVCVIFFFLMIRRPPISTQSRSSAASDVYKRQEYIPAVDKGVKEQLQNGVIAGYPLLAMKVTIFDLSLIHISEPTRPY